MKKFICLFIVLQTTLFAAYFQPLVDNTTPNCPKWDTRRFNDVETYMTFGVSGATNYGFDHEVSISREGVDILWCAVKIDADLWENKCSRWFNYGDKLSFERFRGKLPDGQTKGAYSDRMDQYTRYFDFISKELNKEHIDADCNVGLILELLTRHYLYKFTQNYPSSRYTVTGGVMYASSAGSNTLGELDVIVYDKKTCEVVMIGESKATTPKNMRRMLNKAKSQLSRFKNFITRY